VAFYSWLDFLDWAHDSNKVKILELNTDFLIVIIINIGLAEKLRIVIFRCDCLDGKAGCTSRINSNWCFHKDYRHSVAYPSGAEHR